MGPAPHFRRSTVRDPPATTVIGRAPNPPDDVSVSFKVIESTVVSRAGEPGAGRDRIVVTTDVVAVVDGATPKTGDDPRAALVVDTVCETLATLPPDATAVSTVAAMTDAVARLGLTRSAGACATFVAYVDAAHEVWSVGDGRVLIDERRIDLESAVDRFLADVRAFVLTAELESGASPEDLRRDDVGRRAIAPLLERLHRFRNLGEPGPVWRHAAIDGTTVPPDLIRIDVVPESASTVVLATDGYPWIGESLAKTEQMLRSTIEADPLLIGRHRATKAVAAGDDASFDDRAYVRLRVDRGAPAGDEG